MTCPPSPTHPPTPAAVQQPAAVTALHWDATGTRLFSGDSAGCVGYTRLPREGDSASGTGGKGRLSAMFQSAVRTVKGSRAGTERVIAEESSIVQVGWCNVTFALGDGGGAWSGW